MIVGLGRHGDSGAALLLVSGAVLSVFGLVSSGCESGVVAVYDVPAPAEVSLTLTLHAEDANAAQALGWLSGRIPWGHVRLTAADTVEAWSAEGLSDQTGVVVLDKVPPGTYRLQVSRLLTPDERAHAAPHGVIAFVYSGPMEVGTSGDDQDLMVPASRARSLVFSEIRSTSDLTSSGGYYSFSRFVELYNNADTTIYLDGKVIGMGFNLLHDYSPNRPCSMFTHLRTDPRGIWARVFEMFPGSGRTYALTPGRTAVVALDAIDHRPFAPGALDLSGADFESRGPGDVDNPAVPDMVNIGLVPDTPRGLQFRDGVVFIAEPVETAALERDREPDSGREWARIPAERLLDVVVHIHDIGFEGTTYRLCPDIIAPSFDRSWVQILSVRDTGISLHRRHLFALPDDRVVLQHTASSFADFVRGPVSPGSVLR